MFESTAAGLESERVKLELQCGRNQDEALKVEREYHMLNCMLQKAEVDLERVELEEQFSKGEGQLLPDFKSFQELYQNKISQQQSLLQALRKHQNALKKMRRKMGRSVRCSMTCEFCLKQRRTF